MQMIKKNELQTNNWFTVHMSYLAYKYYYNKNKCKIKNTLALKKCRHMNLMTISSNTSIENKMAHKKKQFTTAVVHLVTTLEHL